MYSEKAANSCEISTLLLSYVVPVKSKVEISQNFVAFSEYMNFKIRLQRALQLDFWPADEYERVICDMLQLASTEKVINVFAMQVEVTIGWSNFWKIIWVFMKSMHVTA